MDTKDRLTNIPLAIQHKYPAFHQSLNCNTMIMPYVM